MSDDLTRLAIYGGCLCPATEAGSRLSRWRPCPIHTFPQASELSTSPSSSINPSGPVRRWRNENFGHESKLDKNSTLEYYVQRIETQMKEARQFPRAHSGVIPTQFTSTTVFNPFDNEVAVTDNHAMLTYLRAPHSKTVTQPGAAPNAYCTSDCMQKVTKWLREMETF